MKLKMLLLISICMLVQACAVGPQRTLLAKDKRSSLENVKVYNLVIQDEVKPAINVSNVTGAMGGGLIPALIDSSINKKRSNSAQDIIEPLYNATEDLDYRVLIAEAMGKAISENLPTADLNNQAETILLSNAEVNQRVNQLKAGEALMYLSSSYGFKDDSKVLMTETSVMLFESPVSSRKKYTGNKLPKPIYFNRFTYLSDPVGRGSDNSMMIWSENNGGRFRNVLRQSTQDTAHLLTRDLKATSKEACGRLVQADTFALNDVKTKMKGNVFEEQGNRLFMQDATGAQHSVSASSLSPVKGRTKKSKACI